MRAYICDACGNTYRPYFKTENFGDGNGLTIVKIERDGQMRGKLKLELCPTCMKDAWDYLKTGLVQEGSPAFTRLNREASNVEDNE